jgi:chromosome partitioning protein
MNPLINIKTKPLPADIGLAEIKQMEARVSSVLSKISSTILAPTSKKSAPTFSTAQLSQITGLEKSQITYRIKKGDLPSGTLSPTGARREWTLEETRLWAQDYRKDFLRPERAAGATIVVANFKGGVTKTTTAVTIAQGLSLRGHKVLVVDTDPQGSLTTLFGIKPDTEVEMEDTILPLYQGDEEDLSYAVRPTYWDGIDIVAAAPLVFDAEFALPARQAGNNTFEFWKVLDLGLDPLRDKYDVIIIDTPPAFSYSTINALMAADGVVIPLPPNTLDFASSAQFWRLYVDLVGPLLERKGANKKFNFINVLLTRVDTQDTMSTEVRRWILSAYGDSVLPIEIPMLITAPTANAAFGTPYKSGTFVKNSKRSHDAYERLVELMEEQVIGIWVNQTFS